MSSVNYEALAALFAHPGPSFEADVARVIAFLDGYPSARQALQEFERLLPKGDLLAQQELHTRTFDVQPITSLDIGYTLFGEDYKRGALLANLNREHACANHDCGAELADHLTHVLALLPKLLDLKLREELVRVLLVPALREMIREFEPARLAQKEALYKRHHKTIIETADGELRTAYRFALLAVQMVLQADFALKVGLPLDQESKFARTVGAEMGIESDGPCAVK